MYNMRRKAPPLRRPPVAPAAAAPSLYARTAVCTAAAVVAVRPQDRMPAHGRAKTLVSANGLNPRYFVEGANDNMRFMCAIACVAPPNAAAAKSLERRR